MKATYEIEQGYAVLQSSITDLDITTRDADGNGYLRNDGGNRSLKHGIMADGTHAIWTDTNGGVALGEDLDSATAWCRDMGDAPADDDERARVGAERLMEAVVILRARYAGNEAALKELEWYEDRAQMVLDELADGD